MNIGISVEIFVLLLTCLLLILTECLPGARTTTQGATRYQSATEQYAAGGIGLVIDEEELIEGQDGQTGRKNMTAAQIEKLRATMTPEGLLYREIMNNYDAHTRPVINASDVVNINLTFTFSQVLDVEEKEQSLTVILWMDHYWYDEKLLWDPADFNGIDTIKIPSKDIWLPDIVLYNTAEERIQKPFSNSMSRVFVKHTGEIFFPPVKRLESSCNIDITYFPFDDQICYLKLGSWAYDGFQVNVWNTMTKMDMTHARTNSEFQVVDSSVRRYITHYDCCIEPYPDIKVFIHIRRQTIQHVFNIVIPCVVLSIICMVGFLIPPDKIDEKISVQLTVLFSLSLFMLLVAESTPRTSESVPLISIYLTALMCITAMSTTVHVVVDKLVASSNVRNKVPYHINKLLYRLAKICHKHNLKEENAHEEDEQTILGDDNTIEMKVNGIHHTHKQNGVNGKLKLDKNSNGEETVMNGSPARKESPSHEARIRFAARAKRGNSVPVLAGSSSTKQRTLAQPIDDSTEEGLQGLFHHLKIRQDKMRTEFQETAKWFKVATKMDRVFFWGYGITVTILTLYAFVFKPMQKNISLSTYQL